MKNNTNKRLKSRIFMALVAVGMLLFSCACGKEEKVPIDESSHVPGEEYGYVSEIHTMKAEEFGEYGMRIPFFTEDAFFIAMMFILTDHTGCRSVLWSAGH